MSDIIVEFIESPTINVEMIENVIQVEITWWQWPAWVNWAPTLDATEW